MPIFPADPVNPVALEIGVIIVTYRAADFISDCLESLLACGYPGLKVVVVDNLSPDATCATIREWAQGDIANLRGDWPFGPDHRAPRAVAFTEYAAGSPEAGSLATVTLIHSGDCRTVRTRGTSLGHGLAAI